MGGRVKVTGDPDLGVEAEVEYVQPKPFRGRTPETADTDLVVGRPDLGRGAVTLVREGDVVPAAIAHFPCRASTSTRKKRGRKPRRTLESRLGRP